MALQESNEKAPRISWYRCPIDPAKLRELTKRSDAKGLFYSLGNLLLLGATGYAAFYFFTDSKLIAKVNSSQPAERRDWTGVEGADRTKTDYRQLRRARRRR